MITADTSDLNRLKIELANVHKAALPNAVRFTLSDLAFQAKKVHYPKAFNSTQGFEHRDKQFPKLTYAKKATGYDITTMYSEIGFDKKMFKGATAQRTFENMEKQDFGGSTKHSQAPLREARTSSSHNKKVKKSAFWQDVKIHRKVDYGNKRGLISGVISSGISSGGKSKKVAIQYGNIVYRIIGYKRIKSNVKLHLEKLYSLEKGRTVSFKANRWSYRAGAQTAKELNSIFTKNAEKQLKKFTR